MSRKQYVADRLELICLALLKSAGRFLELTVILKYSFLILYATFGHFIHCGIRNVDERSSLGCREVKKKTFQEVLFGTQHEKDSFSKFQSVFV
jgi:hypothetical protein